MERKFPTWSLPCPTLNDAVGEWNEPYPIEAAPRDAVRRQTGACCDGGNQAGLVAEFGRRHAGVYVDRLDDIRRDLIREDAALLVRDGLIVDAERSFRELTERVKTAVGIGGDTR